MPMRGRIIIYFILALYFILRTLLTPIVHQASAKKDCAIFTLNFGGLATSTPQTKTDLRDKVVG